MFLLIPRVNEDVSNKDDNEQYQVLFKHFVHQIIKVAGALVSPNKITTNS